MLVRDHPSRGVGTRRHRHPQNATLTADGQPIRVVIVDDYPLFLESLQQRLSHARGIAVVGVGTTGRAAFRLVRELRPRVLVLDLELPDMSGVTLAEQVRARHPDVAIVAQAIGPGTGAPFWRSGSRATLVRQRTAGR